MLGELTEVVVEVVHPLETSTSFSLNQGCAKRIRSTMIRIRITSLMVDFKKMIFLHTGTFKMILFFLYLATVQSVGVVPVLVIASVQFRNFLTNIFTQFLGLVLIRSTGSVLSS